jgi:dienelactone hydrolase
MHRIKRFQPYSVTLLSVFPLLIATALLAQSSPVAISTTAGAEVVDGDTPGIVVTGLRAGELVTIHAFRRTGAYDAPTYAAKAVVAHAQGEFIAAADGTIHVDTTAPLRGTYVGIDPLGMLWSGVRMPLAGDPTSSITQGIHLEDSSLIVLRVEAPSLGAGHWVELQIRLTDGADHVMVQNVETPLLNGAFARPKTVGKQPLPTILLLHGSEGGSAASARADAIRFAQLGYAAFALNYFAWPGSGLSGVPDALANIPVESLEHARSWLLQQPGIDARTVAVWGVSKGAEFALVGAAYYPWIRRVVACVPSSVVWSGFGRAPRADEVYSSWSIHGVGLPYIPYDHYEDALSRTVSSAYVHERSFARATTAQQTAARIPLEHSNAKVLLLAATNDVVWPSASMVLQIQSFMRAAKKDQALQLILFQDASHYICGTGTEPRRINPVHKPEGNDPTPEADAYAAHIGWSATKTFLVDGRR